MHTERKKPVLTSQKSRFALNCGSSRGRINQCTSTRTDASSGTSIPSTFHIATTTATLGGHTVGVTASVLTRTVSPTLKTVVSESFFFSGGRVLRPYVRVGARREGGLEAARVKEG